MLRGLDGRRIALFASENAQRGVAAVTKALEAAGARLHVLKPSEGSEEDWHGSRYVGLVLIGDEASGFKGEPRLAQLAREFLLSEKPIAAHGGAVGLLHELGGVDESLIMASASSSIDEFVTRVIREFSERLEERDVDEMSDLSFPASDPPAFTPSSVGRVSPDTDARQ